jgi:hypothetical protein
MTGNNTNAVQTRPGRCETHGLVKGNRKMPRLIFPFINTGALRLVALTRPFRCPRCGVTTTKGGPV